MDQQGLVERAQRGDHDAFAVLAGASIARLDAAARLIVRDHDLARDAVQETLVRCWRDLPTLRDVVAFDAWLHQILVNACLDLVRRRKRRPVEVELTALHAPATSDFSGQLIDRDLLERALGTLDPEWRAIVVLHYFLEIPDARSGADRRDPARHGQVASPPRPQGPAGGHDRRRRAVQRARRGRTVRMTTIDRFEHELPAALSDVAGIGRPDYLTDILGRTAHTRQRPAWASLERWLPMDLATPRAATARIPWRALGVLALIAILMAAAIALYAGSQRHVPPPFGPAVNGLIPYVREWRHLRR